MRGSRTIAFIISAITCLGCGSKQGEEITGIDWEAWKSDRSGCELKRKVFADTLALQTDRLKSLSEMEILELMGRPDETELLERNQKFFTYFLYGGPGCVSADSSRTLLAIRFNAVGLAKEVRVQKE